ncbi:MAG: hypothetical protein J1E96_05355 [Ruminococcus sp.]|nr:hypothetical protein [Ruminococcus sp.]
MKKITALFLACIMLFSALPAIGVSAASNSKESTAVTEFPCEIGELNDGYKLYFNGIEPVTWEEYFDVVYGKYTFTSTNEGERGHGLFVAKGDEKMFLSEAIERGITDIDTAVALIKSRNDIGYPFYITNMDDVYAALEKRYNGRKFNLVDLGGISSQYHLYYNVPEMICCWVLKFEYSGYTFTEYGGQIGSDIPEDLGLYVVGNGEVYNLEEADKNPKLSMDIIVKLIKAKDIDYSFYVEKTPTGNDPTEPVSNNTDPKETGSCIPTENTTPTDAKTDRELLVQRTKKPENQFPIYELGEVIVGYKLYYQLDYNPPWEQKFEVKFGKYVFTQYLSEHEESLGLYIIGNGTVYSLSDAFCVNMTDIDKVVELIKSSNNIPFHFSVSVDENNEPDTTQPTTGSEPFEIAGTYEIGELKDGYKLYYWHYPPLPWMRVFDVVYGKYTFTHFNGEGEENLGLYVQKGDDKMFLSEAIEKGITDIETAVALLKTRSGYSFKIINIEDVEAQLEKRYNGRKFNLVDLGSVYTTYRLYYNQPELICTWVLTFEYGGYTFIESGGQVGSMIPEDLGLYVVGNGRIFNLEEASEYPDFSMDKIVELINAQDIDYTFKVVKTPEKTEPSTVQQPSTTPKKTLKEKFLDYLYELYHTADYGLPLIDYAELGNLSIHTKLIYGYHLMQPIEGSDITLGEYTIWSPATDNISGAGLYVYYDNGTFNRFEEVKDKYNVSDIVDLIKNAPAEHKFKVTPSTAAQLMEERYGKFFRDIVSLGEVADGYNLYYNIPSLVCDWLQEFEYGDYIFYEYGGQWGVASSEDLGLFIIGNGKVYNLDEAYKNEIVDIEKVVELVRANKLPYIFTITKKEPETTQPDTTIPTEPDTTTPTNPPTTCPRIPDNTPLGKYKQFLAKNQKDKNPDDFEVDVFKKLKSGLYLVHHVPQASLSVVTIEYIDKYIYIANGSGYEVYIFDANKEKTYDLAKAFKKGVITKKHLKTISKTLDKVEYVAKLRENIVSLIPGITYSELNGKSIKVTSSKPKVVKVIKDKNGKKQLVAMKKGTAKITVKKKNGTKYSFKVKVKRDPEFADNAGNTIKSVTVKKGSKVKVQIVGKVKGIDNIYKDTKYAKITSKKTAKTLTVKGLKKGKTNLTIYVNGKSLSLKVKVK